MRILVTGALGTIGTPLCKHLSKQHEVFRSDLAIDDQSDYMRCDITVTDDVTRLFAWARPDITYHLAAECGIINCEEHQAKTYETNLLGTLNVVRGCLEHGSSIVNFSTSEVYGELLDSETVASPSSLSHTGTRSVYAHSKLAAEGIVQHYARTAGLSAITVRPFMVYGPDEKQTAYRSMVARIVRAVRTGELIEIHNGSERGWCYIDDFVDALALLINAAPGFYDIGSDDYRSIEELSVLVMKELGKTTNISYIDPPMLRCMKKRADFGRIESYGWKPKVTLEEGVARCCR